MNVLVVSAASKDYYQAYEKKLTGEKKLRMYCKECLPTKPDMAIWGLGICCKCKKEVLVSSGKEIILHKDLEYLFNLHRY